MSRPPAHSKCYRTGLPKSPFFKGGLYQHFLIVPPFFKGGLGGIKRMPPSENTFGKRYNLGCFLAAADPFRQGLDGRHVGREALDEDVVVVGAGDFEEGLVGGGRGLI